MHSHRLSAVVVFAAMLAVVLGWGSAASAEISKNVIAAFKGDFVITKGELPDGKTEKETIAKIKSERLKELTGEDRDKVVYWTFHYTAFLSKTGATQLKLEFYSDKRLMADKRLEGVDPKSVVLSGEISINEDEGLLKGKPYVIKLVTDKDVVVASSTLVMK